VKVHELLDLAVSLVESKAHQKGITIHREGAVMFSLTCDPQSMSHVFVNLLDNSCDAVMPQGKIWLRSACEANGDCRTEVVDDGSGFPEGFIERLGEPFITNKDAGKGIGLGLAMSKLIVEKNSGKLELANLNPGAIATVTFPASLCQATPLI
jgi:signal transduction histidine kinase